MPGWSRTGWQTDESNGLILFRIPLQIDLLKCLPQSQTAEQEDPAHKISPIILLPTELHHEIVEYLHPIDRVCLGLTCKILASSILSAPRLSPPNWHRFADRYSDWLQPESYSLILRLAHGWIPKDKLRYCWKCHQILPREEAYFRQRLKANTEARHSNGNSIRGTGLRRSMTKIISWRKKHKKDKMPKWSVKVGMPKEEWNELSKKDRYTHLIKTWCHATTEDSSCLYCEFCREQKQVNAQYLGAHPVECPSCLQKELTFTWRRPRESKVRATLAPLLAHIAHFLYNLGRCAGLGCVFILKETVIRGVRCLVSLPCFGSNCCGGRRCW